MADKGWCADQETVVRRWMKTSRDLQQHHRDTSDRYARYNVILNLTTTLLSGGAGGSLLGSLMAVDGTWGYVVTLGAGIAALLSAISSEARRLLDWGQVAHSHALAAIIYTKIENKLAVELSFPVAERKTARQFMQEIQDDITTAQETCSHLPTAGRSKPKFRASWPTEATERVTRSSDSDTTSATSSDEEPQQMLGTSLEREISVEIANIRRKHMNRAESYQLSRLLKNGVK